MSGWLYPGWRGVFYPKELRRKDELAYAADRFDTIEINGTFYSLKRPEHFAQWRDGTPEDFVFAVKGSRFITHMKQLRALETPPPIPSPPACWRYARSSARFCGNCRRASPLTRSGSTAFWRCCRAIPRQRPAWRDITTGVSPDAH